MSKQTMNFQAEVKEILSMMVHSLYSQKEIFLRELISNASDAIDKLRFESLTNKDLVPTTKPADPCILLTPNSENKTLTISDNGIGMSHEEVIKNIGTIAHSGTKEFIKARQELKENPELIGQFGVGFYSAFMVAEKVTLHTQKAGSQTGTLWESTGDGSFTIAEVPRAEGHGTSIILQLKDFSAEDSAQDFSDEWTLKSIVKKYSDFISFPIKMKLHKPKKTEAVEGQEPAAEKTPPEMELVEETVNSQKALWLRPSAEITAEEYKEFYHHVTHDWSEPLKTIHFKAEGTSEFSALMFIPKTLPFDYNYRETKFGLNLYVKRVFILNNCEDLVPHYMRFLKGVVDSSDLSLNVSREILQKDAQVQQMKKAVVNKVLGFLKDTLKKERPSYEDFWKNFGASIKEGLATDLTNKEKLSDLVLFQTSEEKGLVTLEEYVARMKPEQKSIYYINGESTELLKNSPYLERLKNKGYEVLFLTDAVDEWVMRELPEYKGKKLISLISDQLDIDSEEEKKAKEEENKLSEEKFGDLKKFILETLKEQVKEVKFSDRLVDSPVCLVSATSDPSARMERLMEAMGQAAPKAKRLLEINPKHQVFEKLLKLNDKHKADWIDILYTQALLNEGSPIQDPAKFSKQISNLMIEAQI